MTAQAADLIFFEGKEYVTFDEPLSFLEGLPEFLDLNTGNIKGYVALWVVVANRLFIASLNGYVPGRTDKGLGLVFSNAQAPIFASWYSGRLRLLGGQLLKRSEINPIYQHEVLLVVKNGEIQECSLLDRTGEAVCHEFDPMLSVSIELLEGFSPGVIDLVRNLGVSSLGDLVEFDGLEFAKATGLGIDAVIDIKNALSTYGLSFGMHLQGWPPKQSPVRPL